MTFPTIKDSPVHKTSTTKPTVSMTRTQADPSLVAAASELGKSNIPGAIDYEINIKQPTFSDSKSKSKLKPSKREVEEQRRKDVLGDQYEDPFAPRYTDIREDEEKPKSVKEKFNDTYSGKTEVDIRKRRGHYDPEKDKDSTEKERRDYKKKKEEDFEKMIVTPEDKEADSWKNLQY